MAQVIGIRYSSCGVRVLGLDMDDSGIRITGISAGYSKDGLRAFLETEGFTIEGCTIAIGLCPGDFLSATVVRSEEMDDETMREQLRWEIERKMISDSTDFNISFTKNKVLGFAFAGRRELINDIQESLGKVITDVEPVALYNGCISANEVVSSSVIITSVEAEGISSVVLSEGSIQAMESVPIREDSVSDVIAKLCPEKMENIDPQVTDRLAGYIVESINRLTTGRAGMPIISPEHIILAGDGVYAGDLAGELERRIRIPTTISNPLASFEGEVLLRNSNYMSKSAAFTTCFGLAVRALASD